MHVSEVVPFLAVRDMVQSLTFYVDGLGFLLHKKWVVDNQIRWCSLRTGDAHLMLQQFATEGHDSKRYADPKGEGVQLCFFLDDAVEFYHAVKAKGLEAQEPCVENGQWVTYLKDPDGFQLLFESPTDAPEGTKL